MLDLSILNKEQRKAVETTDGALLVLAGAGSGKTRVLIYRIAYILDAGLAGPDNILAMTFTNKAAGEMKHRILKLLKENNVGDDIRNIPWMGTFHSICVRILKQYGNLIGLGNNFSIYDSDDQSSAVKEAMKRADISTKEINPKAILNYISSAKNELIDPETYETYANGYFQQAVASVYPIYQKILRENNAVDFDDLIMLTIKLMQENPQTLRIMQEKFKYILVDEYQDTNHAQYILVKMFASFYKNICCVGDDDQSIYSFRGATIKNILTFENDYPEVVVVKLEQNYRSTKKILEASYQVISKNKSRKEKKLWTENGDGNSIIVYTARDEKDEGRWIVDKITELKKTIPLSEVAVLYRTNAQSRALEEAFIRSSVPYKIVGGVRFYERKEIKDVIAYLKVLYNPRDSKSLERIINMPRRGIGSKSLQDLSALARKDDLGVAEYLEINFDNSALNPKVKEFGKLLKNLKDNSEKLNIVDFINHLLEHSGYIKMLSDNTAENEARIENIKELISVASKYIDEEPKDALEKFLEEVSLLEEDRSGQEGEESVTLMTIHAAKGLEFQHVFVAGMEENLFPHSNSLFDQTEMEEERRLAYVAITRAKEQLYLTNALNRLYFGVTQSNMPSRFVEDIDEKLKDIVSNDSDSKDYWEDAEDTVELVTNSKFKKGDHVKHEYFGVGTIKFIDSDIMEVDFGAVHGLKELMLEYTRLTKVT